MLEHSFMCRVEQSFTVRGVKAGRVVGLVSTTAFPSPRAEHVGADDPLGAPSAQGIALEDAAPGQSTAFSWIVLDEGVMVENPEWDWRPGAIFLGADGALTQEERPSGWSTRIGVAFSPTTLCCGREQIDRDYPAEPQASAAASDFRQF